MDVKVVMDPVFRKAFSRQILDSIGLFDVEEEESSAYCPISMTSVPNELKPYLAERQKLLMDTLKSLNINAYDPGTSDKYSPDLNLDATHREVYFFDAARVANGEYFTGHKILPSDGQGVESQLASLMGKKSVIFLDERIRVSRMMPSRTIYLSYNNFAEQINEVKSVFEMLQQYKTGLGIANDLPVLVGFHQDGGKPVDLEDAVYQEFPHLQFKFDGKLPIIKLKAENPELFYEHS